MELKNNLYESSVGGRGNDVTDQPTCRGRDIVSVAVIAASGWFHCLSLSLSPLLSRLNHFASYAHGNPSVTYSTNSLSNF